MFHKLAKLCLPVVYFPQEFVNRQIKSRFHAGTATSLRLYLFSGNNDFLVLQNAVTQRSFFFVFASVVEFHLWAVLNRGMAIDDDPRWDNRNAFIKVRFIVEEWIFERFHEPNRIVFTARGTRPPYQSRVLIPYDTAWAKLS